ncbi:hypothetical protein BH09MYX1_BH09MYX1_54490 [soil metagenome]
MARSSFVLVPLFLLPIVVACGDAAPSAHTPNSASTGVDGRPSAGPTGSTNGGAPVATVAATSSGAATNPTGPAPNEPPDLTREQLLHVSDADDTPAVVAHRYGPAKLTDAQRVTAFVEIGSKYKQTVTDRASLAPFVAWLKTRKELEDAGTHGLTVWARFIDGRMLIFLANPAKAKVPAPAKAELSRNDDTRAAKELPKSATVIGIDTVGYDPQSNAKMVTYMKEAGHRGDSFDGSVRVTVPFLASAVAGQGLLNWNGHGGSGTERDGHSEYVLQTSTPVRDCAGNPLKFADYDGAIPRIVTAARCSDAPLEPYLASGELAYTAATIWQNGRIESSELHEVWAYALTHRFVKNHFKLAEHAIVMLDACQAGTSEGSSMRGAFLGAGADVVMAWGDDVEPTAGVSAAQYFWYLLLGATSTPELTEAPIERPWDLEHTFAELQRRHMDVSHTADGTMALLRPSPRSAKAIAVASLTYVEVDEQKQKLTLHGDFGDVQPAKSKVTVGDKECAITSFAADKVECDAGPAFNVEAVRFDADGRKSNAVPLTGWKVSADYVAKYPPQMPGSFSQTWHFDAHFRAAVHQHREQVNDKDGKDRDPFDLVAAHDSTCTPAGIGQTSLGAAGSINGAGGAAIPATFGPPSASGTCIIIGHIDPKAKTLALAVMAMGGVGAININTQRPVSTQTPPAIIMDEMKDTTVSTSTGRSLNGMTVELDSSWAIIARRSPSKHIGPCGEIYLDVKATPAMPYTAPDDKTAE